MTARDESSRLTSIVDQLQVWAATELRDLPWRQTRDPWHILVSEIMLQQTQVSRVVERYAAFIDRFPNPTSCAAAPSSAVIELWAGLGYNRRAVNLWRSARDVVSAHAGQIPNDLAALLTLPGVGPYTARAILVFAFERDIGVVDTNVGRLLARWTGRTLNSREAQALADELVPQGGGWLWNQALFDYASAICTKRDPACGECVLVQACTWRGIGDDPSLSSAGVSTRQSRFAGSERQVRGRIVDALRVGPMRRSELASLGRPNDSVADLERIVALLVADGLAEFNGELVQLPS